MSESYRIRTEIGKDKELRINLNQEYETLEILSLKIRQSDLYLRNCSDYGVIVGRVFANNGFGIPNAKINVFIPLTEEDAQNPVISVLYPYTSLDVLNEDGYRYNLLPYTPSYPNHAATGTFPDRKDVLTNSVVSEIYEKYYKFTVKTNESGDFMIFGVPTGMQKLFMDLDLSDIGDFSLTPQDLIRIGRGTKDQFDGINFKTSSDLGSLPQIISLVKDVYVAPLWGENDICQIGITRSDFDLTTEASIEIRPTSVFMGSIISTTQKYAVKANCKVKRDAGDLCNMISGPGEILAIRQTIFNDSNGRPILEQASLPDDGKVIDENGSWMFELPMNMDYLTTNEFGDQVISDDPSIGVPTTAKYRFKIKWSQSRNVNEEIRRAYYLVPNLREYGNDNDDTQNSYAFSLDWKDYEIKSDDGSIQEFINCEDRFYKFKYNKIYTVSNFIDNYKTVDAANRFLAIKEVTDPRCDSENLKFPVNDGVMKKNFLIIVFNILLLISQPILFSLIVIFNILAPIWEFVKLIANNVIGLITTLLNWICQAVNWLRRRFGKSQKECIKAEWNRFKGNPFKDIRVPMLTYPDCELCDQGLDSQTSDTTSGTETIKNRTGSGYVAGLADATSYSARIEFNGEIKPFGTSTGGDDVYGEAQQNLFAGIGGLNCDTGSQTTQQFNESQDCYRIFTYELPIPEKFNLLNTRDMYYQGFTKVDVYVEPTLNNGKFHSDNLMVLMLEENNLRDFPTGQLITFVDDNLSSDPNIAGASYVNSAGTTSITGATCRSNLQSIKITYGDPDNKFNSKEVEYTLSASSKFVSDFYTFPIDIEYFQVVTGITVETFLSISNDDITDSNIDLNDPDQTNKKKGLNGILRGFGYRWFETGDGNQYIDLNNQNLFTSYTNLARNSPLGNKGIPGAEFVPLSTLSKFKSKNLIFLQRGVDPKSPRYDTVIDVSNFFDQPKNTVKVRGLYKINVPIQREYTNGIPCASLTKQRTEIINNGTIFNPDYQKNVIDVFIDNNKPDTSSKQYSFFKSHFYQPATSKDFSGFTTNAINFYSALDRYSNGYKIGLKCHPDYSSSAETPSLGDITQIKDNRSTHPHRITRKIEPWVNWSDSTNNYKALTNKNNFDDYSYLPFVWKQTGISKPGEWRYETSDFYLNRINGKDIDNPNSLVQLDGGSYALQSLYRVPTERNDLCNRGIYVGANPFYMSFIYNLKNKISIKKDDNPEDTRTVFRSDRLPSSSNFIEEDDGSITYNDIGNNKFLWQQNLNIAIFSINDEGGESTVATFNTEPDSTGTDANDFDQSKMNTLLESVNCKNLVGLKCYKFGVDGKVNIKCEGEKERYVQNGAYVFVRKPVLWILEDFANLAEYISRIRINFALCQGVLSEVFNNNWVNGTLFMFPFKQSFIYNRQNKISQTKKCDQLIIQHKETNTFYYRSTPFYDGSFDIKKVFTKKGSNDRQIMSPTTIIDLGPKSPLLIQSSNNVNFLGYIADKLPQTSFSDTSELINIFALSRMFNDNFIEQLLAVGSGGINDMFSRPGKRVDGDYAQLSSINSQFGINKFDQDTYTVSFGENDPIRIFGGKNDPLVEVFFSASAENLEDTDKISPGRITYRTTNISCSDVSIKYGIESQLTPHYTWNIEQRTNAVSIFGSQKNNWLTNNTTQKKYQEFDRFYDKNVETYFKSETSTTTPVDDFVQRNYIWNINKNGDFSNNFNGSMSQIVVGAPYHFYFGLKNGATALDKYFKEYLNLEINE